MVGQSARAEAVLAGGTSVGIMLSDASPQKAQTDDEAGARRAGAPETAQELRTAPSS